MEQVMNYIQSLNWADNWIIYIITGILLVFLATLVVKFIINKIKQLWIIALIVVVLTLITYMLFLVGAIELDVLTLVGLSEVSDAIQNFITTISDWFKNVFSLTVAFRFIK